jgi:hypothetical protein
MRRGRMRREWRCSVFLPQRCADLVTDARKRAWFAKRSFEGRFYNGAAGDSLLRRPKDKILRNSDLGHGFIDMPRSSRLFF